MSIWGLLCGLYLLVALVLIAICLYKIATPVTKFKRILKMEGINKIIVKNAREYFGHGDYDMWASDKTFYVNDRSINRVPSILRSAIVRGLLHEDSSSMVIERAGGTIFVKPKHAVFRYDKVPT